MYCFSNYCVSLYVALVFVLSLATQGYFYFYKNYKNMYLLYSNLGLLLVSLCLTLYFYYNTKNVKHVSLNKEPDDEDLKLIKENYSSTNSETVAEEDEGTSNTSSEDDSTIKSILDDKISQVSIETDQSSDL